MNKLPKLKQRAISHEKVNGIYLPSNRKRVMRIYGSKDKNSRSRVIFNNQKENILQPINLTNRPRANVLHSIKNLQFFGEKNKTKVLAGNTMMCNEQLSGLEQNNKSFDDCNRLLKQRKKNRRRAKTSVRLKNALIDDQLVPRDTTKVYNKYGIKMLKQMMENEADFHAPKPLVNHEISSTLRGKMVDWMIEVFHVYRRDVSSFFLAVYILDNYLAKTSNVHTDQDVHSLGLTSMLIASKYSDIDPFCLRDICQKIGHDSFGPNKIKKLEISMLKSLDFDVEAITPDYFIEILLIALKQNLNKSDDRALFNRLERTALQYAKMAVIDVSLVEHKPSEIAFASLSNACVLMLNDGSLSHKKNRLNLFVGFFQTLFQKDPFNKIDIEPIENKLCKHLKNIWDTFPECSNYKNFSLIE